MTALAADGSGRLLVVLSVGWALVTMGQQALPPLLPSIIADVGMSPAAAGVALTVMWALYSLFQYPGGRLVDRVPPETVLVGGLGILTAGFVLLTAATTYLAFVASVSVVGVGGGLFLVSMRTTIADAFHERRGQAFGVNLAAGMAGSVLAAVLVVRVLSVASWHATFPPIVAGLLVTLVAVHAVTGGNYALAPVRLDVHGTGRRLLGTAQLRPLLVAFSLYSFAWQGTLGFLPTFLQAERGFSTAAASAAFAGLFVVGILVMPVAGRLSDRLHRPRVGMGALGCGAVGLGLVVLGSSRPVVAGGLVALAVGLMAYPPAMQAYLMDLFPDGSMGSDFGAVRTVYSGLGSLGPTYVGVVAARTTYATAFVGLGGCLVAGAVALVWVVRRDAGGG